LEVDVRPFPVRLPSARVYWTVLDEDLRVVPAADVYLQHLRFARDAAESTTRSYAGALALYLGWCARTGRDWRSPDRLGTFMMWLEHAPADPTASVVAGPGARLVRGPRRVNLVLTAVREFLRHHVSLGTVPEAALSMLYRISDDRHLPIHVRGESAQLRYWARARHRMKEPDAPVANASDEEVLALLRACRSARDRLIVLGLARVGLRRGELCGLRREDIHFVVDASHLGCRVPGAHVHVIRRDNPNGALAKSRRPRAVPVDDLVVLAYDQYWFERDACRLARASDFVLVNLFREPRGAPMRPGALNELLADLSRRAQLRRSIHPHMLRHSFATNVLEAGGALDEAQALLGHLSLTATQVYLHPSSQRVRAAVERVEALRPLGLAPRPDSDRR